MPNKQSSRTQIKRKTKGQGNRSMVAVAPVWAPGNAGTELKTWFYQNSNYQLNHNTPTPGFNYPNLLDQITQGVTLSSRVGNRIFVKRLRARLVLNNKTDRPNVSYRICVTAAPPGTNTDTFIELFYGGGLTGIHMPTGSQLLHDTVFPLNQGGSMFTSATPKERSFNHTFEIPLNHPVVYSAADQKATTQLTIWIVAYDAFGTLVTDNIASLALGTVAIDFTDT